MVGPDSGRSETHQAPLMYFTDYTAEQGSMHVFQQEGSNKLVD